jgi:hypothetical protein
MRGSTSSTTLRSSSPGRLTGTESVGPRRRTGQPERCRSRASWPSSSLATARIAVSPADGPRIHDSQWRPASSAEHLPCAAERAGEGGRCRGQSHLPGPSSARRTWSPRGRSSWPASFNAQLPAHCGKPSVAGRRECGRDRLPARPSRCERHSGRLRTRAGRRSKASDAPVAHAGRVQRPVQVVVSVQALDCSRRCATSYIDGCRTSGPGCRSPNAR